MLMDHIEALKGYNHGKEYVVAKHSETALNLAKGRKLLGEIPDSSTNQDGTMQVWELPQATKPKVEEVKPKVEVEASPRPKSPPSTVRKAVTNKPKSSIRKRISDKLKGKN